MSFFRSRIFVACVASTVTALVVGGIAWAAQSPVDSSGVVHACYSATNGNMHLNVTGSCPAKGQNTPITWSAGPPAYAVARSPYVTTSPGEPLASGALVAQSNSTCMSIVGFPCTTILGAGFTALTGGGITVQVTTVPTTLDARLSASSSCFGSSSTKYVRLVIDGAASGDAYPLAALPPTTSQQSQLPVSLETSVDLTTAGPHTVQIEAEVGAGSVCAFGWHLIAEAIS